MASTENGSIVEFFRDAVQNNFKSGQAGRPIYDEKDFIRISTPGDTRTVVVELVTDLHKRQYPKSWQAYSDGLDEVLEGTPIAQWTQASLSQAKELAHFNVRTVEQLAAVSDGNLQHMGPGFQALRARAQQYLKSAGDDAKSTEVARENDELREQIKLLKEQNEAMKAQLKSAGDDDGDKVDAPKRGPGRPPKTGD